MAPREGRSGWAPAKVRSTTSHFNVLVDYKYGGSTYTTLCGAFYRSAMGESSADSVPCRTCVRILTGALEKVSEGG